MPELPDVVAYIEALRPRVAAQPIERVRVISPYVVRSIDPPIEAVEGRRVNKLRRLGKRIVLCVEGDLFIVIHLMIAGRLRWLSAGAAPPRRIALATMDFPGGALAVTEASPRKRASIHVVRGEAALRAHDPGGVEPLDASEADFATALRRENHTLKRALTDPRLFSGIGNAYSDEILHAAGLSPVRLTSKLTDDEIRALRAATVAILGGWSRELTRRFLRRFPGPGEVTAFRPEFAVHGRYGKPCPKCATAVQRIRYAENETNYCPRCQTGGRVLADRSLSRLLREDWPRTVEELDEGPQSGPEVQH